jgi:hypothetical protein
MVFQKAAGDYVNARSLVWGAGKTGRGKRRRRVFQAHIKELASMAVSFDPVDYDLRYVVTAK